MSCGEPKKEGIRSTERNLSAPNKEVVEVRNESVESQSRQSRAPMGLGSAYHRGGAPKWGGVRSVVCIIGEWWELKSSHPRVRSVDRQGGVKSAEWDKGAHRG